MIARLLRLADFIRRYAFPHEPSLAGVIDLTADEHHFYFNPYSGDLSLQFPKAERRCRGGILAYVLPFPHAISAQLSLVTVCLILL